MIGSFHSESSNPWKTVVVGYGNTLRGDDGIGPCIAERIRDYSHPAADVVVAHQLAPELAEDLANADCAIFLDACPSAASVEIRETAPVPFSRESMAHTCDPARLLGLTQALYGRAPKGYVVALPARDFALRSGLSPEAGQIAAEGVDTVLGLLERLAPAHA